MGELVEQLGHGDEVDLVLPHRPSVNWRKGSIRASSAPRFARVPPARNSRLCYQPHSWSGVSQANCQIADEMPDACFGDSMHEQRVPDRAQRS